MPRTTSSCRSRASRALRAAALAAVSVAVAPPDPATAHEVVSGAPGDPIAAAVPFVRAFRDADGLPQNTVHSVALDADGYLWAGTADGAARYDGRRWETVEFPETQAAGPVRAIVPTRDGALWFGTQEAGLFRLAGGAWRRFVPSAETYPTPRVNALLATREAEKSTLWVALHDGGLAAFDGSGWRRWSRSDGLPSERIWDLLEVRDADGHALWLATSDGLARLRLSDGAIERVRGTAGSSFSSLSSSRASSGRVRLLAGAYGEGLFERRPDGRWRKRGLEDGLPSLFVTDLEEDPDDEGITWIATDGGGLAFLHHDRIEALDLGPQLDSRAVYKLLETRAEQGASAVWIGSRNNGLLRMSEGLWRVVHPIPGASTSVSALLVDEDATGGSELWAGLDGRGVARWSGGRWSYFDARSGALGNDSVQALVAESGLGPGRRVWVGTRNGGLSVWDGTTWRRHDQASGALPSDLVQTLTFVDRPLGPELWVGTRTGLARFDGTRWVRPGQAGGWPESSIQAVVATPDDLGGEPTVWIGASNGLFRWRSGAMRRWGTEEGLPNTSVLSLHLRRDRSAAHGATLWIGTEGGGVALLDALADDPRVPPPASAGIPRLPNRAILAIVEDAQGRVYLTTNRGVSRLTPAERGPYSVEHFTTQHGLPLNQGMRGAAVRDRRGRIWIGTVGGIGVLEPSAERIDRTPKRLNLTFRRMVYPEERLASGAELDYGGGPLVFRYVLLSFLAEPMTLYRTQLVGRELEPSGWSALTEREVSELPPGSYVFRAWGRDGAGNVSAPVEVEFRIRPAFWQRSTVRWSAAAIVAALFVLFVHERTRRHERREEELEQLVAARTRRLERANEILSELSYIDALTSVPNRRRFDEKLDAEWKRATRTNAPLAVVMIDIDAFKPFNDTYGHHEGDDRLRQVAATLADSLPRSGDLLTRYGGEEFAAILPNTDAGGAMVVADQLRRAVTQRRLPHGAPGAGPHITVSCGVAAAVPDLGLDAEQLVVAADLALYDAKRAGRDRVARREVDGSQVA